MEVLVTYNENRSASENLIAGKMGQMSRLIECNDSLKLKIGNKMPEQFSKLIETRDRIAKNPKNTLAELQSFEKSLESSFDLLLKIDNAPVKEIEEWKEFVLLNKNIDSVAGANENKSLGHNLDDTDLWITGSAIPGNIAKLEEAPINIARYFRYHGKLQTGEFKIINTPTIQPDTKYYVPALESINAVGLSSILVTDETNAPGWSVTVSDDCYKLRINAMDSTLDGELFVARDDLFIVGGATEVGWNSGRAIRLKKDLNNPNLFVFSGTLKKAKSGNDRNMFKLLGQNEWNPVSFHPKIQGEALLGSEYVYEGLPGDNKWAIDETKQGSYTIKVDLLAETISATYNGESK